MTVILITGTLPPAKDNIGEYTCHLATGLREHGCRVEIWCLHSPCAVSTAAPCRSFAGFQFSVAKLYHITRAIRERGDCVILWQYNPFLYGWKGLPSVLYALPPVLQAATRCRVAIVFHELCFTPGRDPRTWVWALGQRVALWMSLWGCDVAIATTQARQAFLGRFARRFVPGAGSGVVWATVPVGTNIPVEPRPIAGTAPCHIVRVGTFRTGLTPQGVGHLQQLYRRLDQAGLRIQLLLIGDGTATGLGRPYHHGDDQPGIIETGYLPADRVSTILNQLDVFIGWYDEGASGRRTSLAAAFAHGLCIIATDGYNTDHNLFRHGENCLLVPYGHTAALHAAVRHLCADAHLREQLRCGARETYEQEMAWPVIARRIIEASCLNASVTL